MSSVGSDRRRRGPGGPSPARVGAGEVVTEGTVDFLAGAWNVVRLISDNRTGEVGSFRGTASFLPLAAEKAGAAGSAGEPGSSLAGSGLAGSRLSGRVLAYQERGELQFGRHRGPASRRLIYRELPDGSADVRFADGREFYRLDLRSGPWSARHPCRADEYQVTATRLSSDSFTETWRAAGPSKDYELTTTYTRTTPRAEAGGGR